MRDAEPASHFLHFDLDVNTWSQHPPDVATARPGRCPRCLAPGAELDGRVNLHGHGRRIRHVRGPVVAADGEAIELDLVMRRYACQRCHAVLTVGPRGLLRGRSYTATAMILALWLWAVRRWTDAQVRAATCPLPDESLRPERWSTLRRWAKAARDGRLLQGVPMAAGWTLRECAERVARGVWARGDPCVSNDEHRVFAAAARIS